MLASVLAAAVGAVAVPGPAEALTPPGRIDSLRNATRAIVVANSSWDGTRAWARTYQRARRGTRGGWCGADAGPGRLQRVLTGTRP